MTVADEAVARAEMGKQQAQMTPAYRGQVVKEWVNGNRMVEGVPLDTSKKAYNGSNRTRAQAEKLLKAQIDSIPVLEGVTPAQTINAMVEHLEKTNPDIFKTKRGPKKKAPSNVSQMLTDDGSSTWNTLKLPENASPAEKKIATMTQQARDKLETTMRTATNANDPMIQEYLNMFNKYRIK